MKLNFINRSFMNLRSNFFQEGENDDPLIPTKDGGTWHILR